MICRLPHTSHPKTQHYTVGHRPGAEALGTKAAGGLWARLAVPVTAGSRNQRSQSLRRCSELHLGRSLEGQLMGNGYCCDEESLLTTEAALNWKDQLANLPHLYAPPSTSPNLLYDTPLPLQRPFGRRASLMTRRTQRSPRRRRRRRRVPAAKAVCRSCPRSGLWRTAQVKSTRTCLTPPLWWRG